MSLQEWHKIQPLRISKPKILNELSIEEWTVHADQSVDSLQRHWRLTRRPNRRFDNHSLCNDDRIRQMMISFLIFFFWGGGLMLERAATQRKGPFKDGGGRYRDRKQFASIRKRSLFEAAFKSPKS